MTEFTKPYLQLGLIGYPVKHSLSPRIHQAALESLGVEGRYHLYPVPPLPEGKSDLEALLEQLRQGVIDGLNVTIPHKQSVLPYLDELTEDAGAIGAVNTLYVKRGRLIGDNTDAAGFWADLQLRLGRWKSERRALVLGAGGAARAVVYALLQYGWHVAVTARRQEQSLSLVENFRRLSGKLPDRAGSGESDAPCLEVLPFTEQGISDFLTHTPASRRVLIVNATPVGMEPALDDNPLPASLPLPEGAFIYDLIYRPAETALLRSARAQGLSVCNGLGMLVEQAVLAFERWTGEPAPRRAMYAAVQSYQIEDINSDQDKVYSRDRCNPPRD